MLPQLLPPRERESCCTASVQLGLTVWPEVGTLEVGNRGEVSQSSGGSQGSAGPRHSHPDLMLAIPHYEQEGSKGCPKVFSPREIVP